MFTGLAGRVALVTGANHGIGAATARSLAKHGASVLLTYLRLSDPTDTPRAHRLARAQTADEVVAAILADGGQAAGVEADLSDPDVIPRLFDAAESHFGPVEILVNNASGWAADTFAPLDRDPFDRRLSPITPSIINRLMSVDARAAALLIAEFARRHGARQGTWGRIIGLTSGGPMGFPGEVSYGAAKAAQVNYTMSAALELGRYGITANVVYPPITDTGWVTDQVRAFVQSDPDHFHVAAPGDVAEVIAFLASDLAAMVTGNVIQMR